MERVRVRENKRGRGDYKSLIVIGITLVYVTVVMSISNVTLDTSLGVSDQVGDELAVATSVMSQDMTTLTEDAVDNFALVYCKKILNKDEYELTMENRAKVERVLNAMGASNIEKLNKATFSGDAEKVVTTVKQLVDENFGWEETAILQSL